MCQQQRAVVLSLVPPLNGKGAPEGEWSEKEGFPSSGYQSGQSFSFSGRGSSASKTDTA